LRSGKGSEGKVDNNFLRIELENAYEKLENERNDKEKAQARAKALSAQLKSQNIYGNTDQMQLFIAHRDAQMTS